MIKLTDLINELDKPENIYAPGSEPETSSDDFLKRGFRTKGITINPETGTVSSEVEYLPAFEQVRKDLLKYRKEFQPFKYHPNESIAKSAKDLNTLLTKAANLVFALDKMVELQRKR
jgi:hypothetical protein